MQEHEASFDTFSDAFGGATGVVRHSHVWTQPGAFEVVLTVADDDGGSSIEENAVEVVDATGAVSALAEQIADLIGSTTDRRPEPR